MWYEEKTKMEKSIVSVYKVNHAKYPNKEEMFRPSYKYPEYIFGDDLAMQNNDVYESVRNSFILRKMDEKYINSVQWNPLKDIVSPGNFVVIKPNLVMDVNLVGDGVECMYTQPSVVAAVIDYVFIALKGKGRIIVGDAPMQECNYEKLLLESGYEQLIQYYRKKIKEKKWDITIDIEDFRGYKSVVKHGITVGAALEVPGVVVDLKDESEFAVYNKEHLKKLRITNYNPEILVQHHTIDKHEYYIAEEILKADVVINMPKPKTHRKAGVTIALKNLVGINIRKEYLPHHCIGEKTRGGDEYYKYNFLKKWKSSTQDKINYYQAVGKYRKARLLLFVRKCITFFLRLFPDQTWEGSWYGNETISKTIADLNKIFLYCNKEGVMCDVQQRRSFIVADMIISGEKDGPVRPNAKQVGVVAMGEQPVCFDEAIATIMGMDISKIPTLIQARSIVGHKKLVNPKMRAHIVSNEKKWNDKSIEDIDKKDTLQFIPTSGWKGHIEL